MKSFLPSAEPATEDTTEGVGNLAPWEAIVVDAVGSVIDFWQFKRNQGRVWALLFLRQKAMTAPEIQESLGLSKGAVSMLVRDLEQWGVIARVRQPQDQNWRYEAESDLLTMVRRVIESRELRLVSRVRHDLEAAEKLARESGAGRDALKRISTMRLLASMVEKALGVFIKTARLDVLDVLGVLNRK
jgi:DNA-binding transcriptional regulator GbsR (MarR family)